MLYAFTVKLPNIRTKQIVPSRRPDARRWVRGSPLGFELLSCYGLFALLGRPIIHDLCKHAGIIIHTSLVEYFGLLHSASRAILILSHKTSYSECSVPRFMSVLCNKCSACRPIPKAFTAGTCSNPPNPLAAFGEAGGFAVGECDTPEPIILQSHQRRQPTRLHNLHLDANKDYYRYACHLTVDVAGASNHQYL